MIYECLKKDTALLAHAFESSFMICQLCVYNKCVIKTTLFTLHTQSQYTISRIHAHR